MCQMQGQGLNTYVLWSHLSVTLYLLFRRLGRVIAAFLFLTLLISPAFCFQSASGKQAASLEL